MLLIPDSYLEQALAKKWEGNYLPPPFTYAPARYVWAIYYDLRDWRLNRLNEVTCTITIILLIKFVF